MKKYNHLEYTENIAIKLKELRHRENDKHFTRATGIANLEEFFANSGEIKGLQLVAIDEIVSGMVDNLSDNTLDRQSHTFFILKNAPVGDLVKQKEVIEECRSVARKCLSKYYKDQRTDMESTTDTGLRNLEKSRIVQQSVGPIGDGFYGIMVMLSILEPSGIKYNTDDWDE